MQLQRAPQLNMIALANRVQPQEAALLAAKLHRASVRTRLEKAFTLSNMRDIGSHCRGTAIRQFSDLDLMVILRKEEVIWGGKLVSSDTVIRRVLGELRGRFASSDIRRDGLAATIAFGSTKQSLDVVPAFFSRFDKGKARPVFLIPNGSGGWFETSPQVHDQYFAQAQERSGNKLRKVAQLVKWWKHARSTSLPIRSFYTDIVLSAYSICVGAKTYGQCLHDFFVALINIQCNALRDPCGIAGDIVSTNTDVQRQQLLASVRYAQVHAGAALEAQQHKDVQEANRQWELVFNGCY
ncbi:nucleotidyltransferase domain-containing protein [Azohydromonas lata]|uniref:Nucleotidyltransferase n=1 Tax=Azohydromonas lata TaxID=45677 RepID=A0ABU5IB13_9BURK|nr:nucleotidyltransferase [Azohydromonas lata]MDZ5455796.1 nucleotidyltransferase [Azohydromonas lata]